MTALTAVDADGTADSRSAEVMLPKNTGTDAVTYYFRYSLDGTTLAGELTATVPGTGGGTQPTEPSVTDYSVAPTELPSNGGMITVTLAGTNLQNGIQIKAGTITAKTSGDAAEQTATLTLPANYSSSSVSYTVQYSLNGLTGLAAKPSVFPAATRRRSVLSHRLCRPNPAFRKEILSRSPMSPEAAGIMTVSAPHGKRI